MQNKLTSEIGALVAQLRVERGITQSDLAKRIGTTQSAIARLESGTQNVSADTLTKISSALNQDIVRVSNRSLNIEINGGKKLKGTIETRTSKNAAVGLLCASLLNKGTTTLKRVPKIEEVHRLIEVLTSLGVNVKWNKCDLIITPPSRLKLGSIDKEAAMKTRSIIMFIGPLIHRASSF
jgi:UDP-N-acetylglucosamine 1-carboxyvinyltransferase